MIDVIPASRALLLALAAVAAVGCHRAQAARVPTAPPVVMDVPDPPERVLTPVTLAEFEPPPPPLDEPPEPAPTPARPAASRPADKPAAAPSPPAPETPAPVLQTTSNPSASEQKVRGLLQSAERDLARVPYNQLSQSARDDYIMARGFVRSATDALTIKNYPFAEQLANRAAVLAAGLLKR